MTPVSVRYIIDDVDAAVAFRGVDRIQIEVPDLEREVEALRAAGASFRGEIVVGRGGSQILLDDPAGNPIELFAPAGA